MDAGSGTSQVAFDRLASVWPHVCSNTKGKQGVEYSPRSVLVRALVAWRGTYLVKCRRCLEAGLKTPRHGEKLEHRHSPANPARPSVPDFPTVRPAPALALRHILFSRPPVSPRYSSKSPNHPIDHVDRSIAAPRPNTKT